MTIPDFSAQEWQYNARGGITSVAVSPDGKMIVAGTLNKSVLCLDKTGSLRWQGKVANQAWRIGLSDDGQAAVVGTGSTRFWDMRGRGIFCFSEDGSLRWHKDLTASVWGLALSADGGTVAVGTSNKQLLLFNGEGHRLWQQDVPGIGWYAWVWSTAVSADGQLVVAGAADKRMRLLERSGNLLAEHQTRGDVFSIAASADGKVVAAGDNQGYAYFLTGNGRLLWEEQLSDKVWQVQLNVDGSRLLVGAGEKEAHLRVYDTVAGRLLWRRFVGGSVSCLAFSAGGQRIAAGTYGGSIYIFDEVGNVVHTARAQQKIRDIALSESGETVIAGSEDGLVYGFHLPLTEEVKPSSIDIGKSGEHRQDEPDATTTTLPPPQAKPEKTFGQQLRYYRRQSTDSKLGGPLTQKRLADFLAVEGFVISDVTISNWERDQVQIPHTDRALLLALIHVLHRQNGIQNRTDADRLLFAGGYRHLDEEEVHRTGFV